MKQDETRLNVEKPEILEVFEFSEEAEEIIEASSPGNCSPQDCNPGN